MKADQITAESAELARAAAEETAADFGVGEYLGFSVEGDRLITHVFECLHPGYPGWRWAVTLVRAARAKSATVNEVSLLPSDGALLPTAWVPWSERIEPGDVAPGFVLPTPDNDPRLEPGFEDVEMSSDDDPAEWSQTRAVAGELGLGRERVLSPEGRDLAAQRWLAGDGGPHNQSTQLAPAFCLTCGYFLRLQGSLGRIFGVCSNEYTPFDGRVVSLDHGCGAHSDVPSDDHGILLPEPVYDTIKMDTNLFH